MGPAVDAPEAAPGGAAGPATAGPATAGGQVDSDLVERLRSGDETAFAEIVDGWSPAMLRVARSYIGNTHSAEDVVQEAWLGVLRGLDGYAGRSSFRTWVFAIVANIARTQAVKEKRTVPVGGLGDDPTSPHSTVDPGRFRTAADAYPGHWTTLGQPRSWPEPADQVVGRELVQVVQGALDDLPARQRTVVSLRDLHQLTAEETCTALGISGGNQRVLLHRGRAAVRAALERYYASG